MTVREKVEGFLKNAGDILLGYNEIIFFDAENLQDEQVGYSINVDGKSLTNGKRGDWKENWLAIGYNELTGDPVMVDMNRAALTVLIAQSTEGDWEPTPIADSIDNFGHIVGLLQDISRNRNTPNLLEANPISDEERQEFFKTVRAQNPRSEMWYWENFLENES